MYLLSRRHENNLPALRNFDAHYEGTQPLQYLHPTLLQQVTPRIQPLVIAWPQLGVDSIEERADVEGFRFGDNADADSDLWDVWQYNNLDEGSQPAHVDALVTGRSYVIVGANDNSGEPPIVTVESPFQVIHDVDPRTRRVRVAMKRWVDPVEGSAFATVYLPDQTVWFERTGGSWKQKNEDNHRLGVVPVVPIVNKARTLNPWGTSELAPIMPLSNAANKIATDMMVAAEHHAVPRRAFFGADPEDFVDEQGKQLNAWEIAIGKNWIHPNENIKATQFPASDLANFHSTINELARLAAAVMALPPNYLGLAADDAASADAIRSREARLVKRVERKLRAFGGAWEEVMRLVLKFQGRDDVEARSLETIWRDPATPTRAQQADAAVKLFAGGLIPKDQAREDLGYTQVQIERMHDMDQVDDAQTLAAFKLPTAAETVPPPDEPTGQAGLTGNVAAR